MAFTDLPEAIQKALSDDVKGLSDPSMIPISIVVSKTRDNLTGENGVEDAMKVLELTDVSKYIKMLLHMARDTNLSTSAKTSTVSVLQDIIYILQTIYNYSEYESPVSDQDYDVLYEFLREYSEDMITVPVLNSTNVVHHKYKTLRGTLSKVYSLGDEGMLNKSRMTLDDWITQRERMYKNATGKDISLKDEEVYLFPKWDGVSIVFEFDERNVLVRALTRGHTETNECQDVTNIFTSLQSSIKDPELTGKAYGLKTEVMMSDKDKDAFCKKYDLNYKNTRSIVSAIINTDTIDGRQNLLEVVGLRTTTLDENGNESEQVLAADVFKRPILKCPLSDRIAIRKFAEANKNIKGLHTDGVVIHIVNKDIQKVLGRENDKNQYEVAYKFNEEAGYAKLKGIQFTVSGFGRVFPVALIEKITLKGNDIRKISLGSIGRMKELKLAKGDVVKVVYEIIPYLDFDSRDPKCVRNGGIPIPIPEKCPECGHPLDMGGTGDNSVVCINPDCPARVRGKILRYIETCRIQGIGEKTVEILNQAGYLRNIPDLYRLKDHAREICSLNGFEDASVRKIINAINHSGKKLDASTFMAAIGIESIGKKIFGRIFEEYDIRELIDLAMDHKVASLLKIKGISDNLALKILGGVKENRKLIEELTSNYVKLQYSTSKFIAVFHNIRSARLSDIISQKGGRVDENLTKETTILIVPDGFNDRSTSTSDKARRYGVPIVEYSKVEEFIESKLK